MGRKLVETGAVTDPDVTTKNIDQLKELFNLLGAQVTEARTNLEKALVISENLMCLLTEIFTWLEDTEEVIKHDKASVNINVKVSEMKKMKLKVRELLSVKTEFISLCGDPSLLSGLKEILSGLEAKWSEVKVMVEAEAGADKSDLKDLSLDSDDGDRIASPDGNNSTEETMLLQQFREAFQEISKWIENTEKSLDNGNSNLAFHDELKVFRPKIDNLGQMAVAIIETGAGNSVDVEPEIESLQQRWRLIVKKIDQRESPGNQCDDDEIVTLPEEASSVSTRHNVMQSTHLKRSYPIESFVECSVTQQQSDMISRSTLSSQPLNQQASDQSKPKKIPPPTLPKPKWYVDSMNSINGSSSTSSSTIPVKQVVVTSSTLPTPQPLTTSPPSSVTSEQVSSSKTVLDDVTLDQQLAKDHADIDRMFDVVSPTSPSTGNKNMRLSAGHSKDIKSYMDTCDTIGNKIAQVKIRLEQVSSESDLGLRSDLIEMETQQVEAQVATTISRGETLILMIHRQDTDRADMLQSKVNILSDQWNSVKKSAEAKKQETRSLKLELEKFTNDRTSLQAWLDEIKLKIESVKSDKKELGLIARQMELKKADLTQINKLGNKLTAANAFKGQEESLTVINQKWEQTKQDCCLVTRRDQKSVSPKESVNKAYPAELNNKISRVREAVNAVDKQLNTSVFSSKKYEKLQPQQDTLDRVKSALETLKPNIKKLEKDLELINGSVSMEYFEKLTSIGEK